MADKERFTSSRSQNSASAIIPVRLLLLIGILALVIGIVASQWVGVALVIVALCVTYAIGAWAGRRSDALVVAVAILLFWMPFQTTVSRLDVSPQEISVYVICAVCALFDRRGMWQWSKDLFTTTSAFMRLAILVFVISCLQSFLRIAHPDLLASANSFRLIIIYPVVIRTAGYVHDAHPRSPADAVTGVRVWRRCLRHLCADAPGLGRGCGQWRGGWPTGRRVFLPIPLSSK